MKSMAIWRKVCLDIYYMIYTCITQVFAGSTDRDSVVTVSMVPAVYGTFLRINPLTWNNAIGLRLELIGCSYAKYQYCKCALCLSFFFWNIEVSDIYFEVVSTYS